MHTLVQLIILYAFPTKLYHLLWLQFLFAHTMVSSHRIRHDAGFTYPYACVPVYVVCKWTFTILEHNTCIHTHTHTYTHIHTYTHTHNTYALLHMITLSNHDGTPLCECWVPTCILFHLTAVVHVCAGHWFYLPSFLYSLCFSSVLLHKSSVVVSLLTTTLCACWDPIQLVLRTWHRALT